MENTKKEAVPELEQRVLELETTVTTLTNKVAAIEEQVQKQPQNILNSVISDAKVMCRHDVISDITIGPADGSAERIRLDIEKQYNV